MVDALTAAGEVAEQLLISTDRAAGWTDEIVYGVKEWLANCQADLRISPHPTRRMLVSWVRWWDAGTAFDLRTEDARRDVILRASNAVSLVEDFEKLWIQVTEFGRLLDQRVPDQYDLDLNDEAACGLRERIEALRDLLQADRPMTQDEIESWKMSLTQYRAKWTNDNGQPWRPGDGRRSWGYQPEIVWASLGFIVDSASDLDWQLRS